VSTSLAILSQNKDKQAKFGIVTTGKAWEEPLAEAVFNFVGRINHLDGFPTPKLSLTLSTVLPETSSSRFAGVKSTGVNATELHDLNKEVVKEKMLEASRSLVRGGEVGVVCLGCAGMAGMDEIVRNACLQELGPDEESKVKIVDGVVAGVLTLSSMLKLGCY